MLSLKQFWNSRNQYSKNGPGTTGEYPMRKMLIWISGFLFLLLTAFSLSFAGESKQLRILYLNDFHGFAQSYSSAGHSEKTGGIAFLAGEVNRLRDKQPALLLAAGDFFQGTSLDQSLRWKIGRRGDECHEFFSDGSGQS